MLHSIALLVSFTVAAGCSKTGEGEQTTEPAPDQAPAPKDAAAPGVKLAEVPAVLEEARRLGKETWPDGELSGIRVGIAVPPGRRVNMQTVSVGFEFKSDPTDATAKAGSVVCAPRCQLRRQTVDALTYPWPACEWERALAVARKAGIAASFPLGTYGNWSGDAIWVFKNNTNEDAAVAVDATTCKRRQRE